MKLRMKILSSFLLLVILASVSLTAMELNLDAMEQKPDKETVWFTCLDEDLVEVPVKIVKHSVGLSRRIEMSEYNLPFKHSIVCAVVDCLRIIDSKCDVENHLCDYIHNFMTTSTVQERRDLFFTGYNLNILPLCSSWDRVNDRMKKERIKKQKFDQTMQKLDDVLQKAKAVFERIEDKENSAIIFDVDDTALNAEKALDTVKVNGINTWISYYPALEKTRDFYKQVVAMGFKIFFLTARTEKLSEESTSFDVYDATVQNLKDEGYDIFEQVICIPYEERLQMENQKKSNGVNLCALCALWKESERNKIAQRFTIAGTLDDTKANLQGENVGHAVLIPSLKLSSKLI